jgi:hypothetical protein
MAYFLEPPAPRESTSKQEKHASVFEIHTQAMYERIPERMGTANMGLLIIHTYFIIR